ncbi:MAG TPA: hypothetical protein PKL85_02220 [Bacteroidia bacterium]|nr:hypothetical protein [Bacteroidia bacterium]
MKCFSNWATYSSQHGIGNIYDSDSDYLPLYQYILFLFGKFIHIPEKIELYNYNLKLITLPFHFISGYFIFRLIRNYYPNSEAALYRTLFYLINFVVLYNTLVWGQTDDILTCFVFGSFYFAYIKKIFPSLLAILLALNFKLQGIVFIPLIGLMLLPEIISRFSWRNLLLLTLPLIATQFLILMPFILSGTVHKVWFVVRHSVDHFPVVSMNAYNMWEFLLPPSLEGTLDNIQFLGISYKTWGLVTFSSLSFLSLLPLIKVVIRKIKRLPHEEVLLQKLVIIAALCSLLFFYCNTQMHERYSHPALIFLILYGILSKSTLPVVFGCAAYFLNVDGVLRSIPFQHYGVFIYSRSFVASLYLITILLLFAALYNVQIFKK